MGKPKNPELAKARAALTRAQRKCDRTSGMPDWPGPTRARDAAKAAVARLEAAHA